MATCLLKEGKREERRRGRESNLDQQEWGESAEVRRKKEKGRDLTNSNLPVPEDPG